MKRLFALLIALLLFVAPAARADALECAACGGVIGPGRYIKDQWGATYHEPHSKLPRCTYCARGISERNTGGGTRYADGRQVCALCVESAVSDDDQAAEVMAQVRDRLAAWGLSIEYGEIPVKLVDQPTLRQMFGRSAAAHGGAINGLTVKQGKKKRGSAQIFDRTVAIYMLEGMPLEVYEQTAAHELMHAWMFLDGQPNHTPVLEEGACNLAAYYLLQENTSPFAGFMREALFQSKDPVYGAGLRRAIRYVQANQFAGLVKMLRANQDFPAGY